MSEQKLVPYGSWKSPITSELAASAPIATVTLTEVTIAAGEIYWRELRPEEQGRFTIMKRATDGQIIELTPSPFNARTTVHEYGGGSFAVADHTVYFSNFSDQRIYRLNRGKEPQPVTPKANMRYADRVIDRLRDRMICVREDHSQSDQNAVNTIASVSLDGEDSGKVLVSGNDFYSSPRLSPDGSRLAWISWNHPNMPWDGTELWLAELNTDGSLGRTQLVAGGLNESIVQPEWSPDGILHFVSDRTGWWNLYRWRGTRVEPLHDMHAEFGRPHWTFGRHTYAFASPEQLICAYTTQGTWKLAELDATSLEFKPIENPYTEITYVRAAAGHATFLAGSPTTPESIVQFDLATQQFDVVYRPRFGEIDSAYVSAWQAIEFPTSHNLTARAFFYAPKNRDITAPTSERPPLIVIAHGGPTSATSTALSLTIQFWTTRGFAVVDVNYGGSTGYGREYRQRLYGQWGVVDVDDCINAANYLVRAGLVDGHRLAIRGGSAGGYTTLCALTSRDFFMVGASYYGVSDLEALDKETHKFESRYNVKLIGPYPEESSLYWERSPIHFMDRVSGPLIIFQGLEDKIVTPSQAEMMVQALRAKELPYAYLAFEGEQHGFRRKENIKRAFEAELYFYSKILGFELADQVEPVEIENLR
jgi:dipeptidyl aminopeptidase/acylaminoacyl peptidase